MRAYKKFGKEGFTLVELMIVVAIIGVLAALAIYGVNKYLSAAKSAEAKNGIGGITRGATAAYERETTPAELLDGKESSATVHALCLSANTVPAVVPAAKKYVPSTAKGKDFDTGDSTGGWKCLRYDTQEPMYYAYTYSRGAGIIAGSLATAAGFEVAAQGDLNGNAVYSAFARGATVSNGIVVLATTLYIENEFE